MNLARMCARLSLVAVLTVCVSASAGANEQKTKSAFERRAVEYDHALVTPPHATPEQHHLIAVTLAAHHVPVEDQSEVWQVLEALASQVTYLAQSDTTFWWDGSQWVPSNRTTFTYSGTKLMETIEQSSFDGVDWVNETRTVNAYDGNGRLSTITTYTWSGVWVAETQTTFTYDGSGNVSNTLSQSWGGSAWVNEFQTDMTYSGANIATMITQMWTGSWVNMRKDIFTYGAFGPTEVLTQSWTGAWNDAERVVYSYDGNGRNTQRLSQLWRNNSWQNWFKHDMAYDGSTTSEVLFVFSDWDTVGSSWTERFADTTKWSAGRRVEMVTAYFTFPFVTRFLYDYDGSGNLVEEINQNGPGPTWMNFSRVVIVYVVAGVFDDDGSDGMPSGFSLSQNYPNPFNMNTLIPYSLTEDSHVRITVCNVLGQTVSTLVDAFQPAGAHTATWNGRDAFSREVVSGVYFFRLQTQSQTATRKMVLLK